MTKEERTQKWFVKIPQAEKIPLASKIDMCKRVSQKMLVVFTLGWRRSSALFDQSGWTH